MSGAGVFVQWKGTDVCLDFTCPCGFGAHFDGDFAYFLRCIRCGRVFEMPTQFVLAEVDDPNVTRVVDGSCESHEIAPGPTVATMTDEDDEESAGP